jgi:hypothetical protein
MKLSEENRLRIEAALITILTAISFIPVIAGLFR